MPTLVLVHEVDDVDHWSSSPRREEALAPLGITVRTFREAQGSDRVALVLEVPDVAAFEDFMRSEAAADAMTYDGVRPETLVTFVEA